VEIRIIFLINLKIIRCVLLEYQTIISSLREVDGYGIVLVSMLEQQIRVLQA
jgi:hypothetical protein